MKTNLIKSLSAILVFAVALFCLGGCVDLTSFHVHDFKWKMDSIGHFKECDCGEISDEGEHSFSLRSDFKGECTSCGYIGGIDNSTKMEKNEDGTLKLSEELIAGLLSYFENILVQYDIGSLTFADKLNLCKNGTENPLLVKFSDECYYVAAYYDAPEGHGEFYCCYEEYTFVGFERAEEVKESWNGKALVGAFQVNPQEFCVNIKTDLNDVVMDHVAFYNPTFVEGIAIDPKISFDNFFVYLTSSDKDYICYSSTRHNALHELSSFKCMELNGKYYIAESHGSIYSGQNLEWKYGEYYDQLMSIMVEEYVVEANASRPRYGLFKIEDIVKIIK